ncbi:SLBB domain-containing protein [Motilimonas pumila]|uniref:Sugar ABC transporter substrate-binding protein n=1 Tax=Motilimonas pumila TaxID=2303987 RepID=A0A418YD55_9GAMM|nr:SLBB domain-containing protein [Motilimonas pumila]RJG42461.1 sugar ABC transporter substrate-binding protein [Motilimonas pumila]
MNTINKSHLTWLRLITLCLSFLLAGQVQSATIQPGDLLSVDLAGEQSLSKPFSVDRQGRVSLPEIGRVSLSGLSEQQAQQKLQSAFQSVFKDTRQLRVRILRQQKIVSVRGYVNSPGEYTLSRQASVQMAIHAAGGLRRGAQLDKVQVTRDNKTSIFNYKQYLDTGNRQLLPQLQSLDAIFVPSSPMTGNVEVEFNPADIVNAGDVANDSQAIKVFGEVNRPGSFAFQASRDIVDLLMGSGGVTRYADVEKIRVITSGKPAIFNLKAYLDTGKQKHLPPLQAGTTIFVPKQEEAIKSGGNMVYVMGEVAHPGAYESQAGATFMDILANAGGPNRFAESRQIRIIKGNGQIVPFDLTAYTEGGAGRKPPTVGPGDAIFVPEKTDMNEKSWLKVTPNRAVRVIGQVVRPGRVEWSNEMSLLDLLAHVGGPSSKADTNNIEIVIPQATGNNQVVNFDLNAFIRNGRKDSELPAIVAGSTIMVHELPVDPSDNKSQWVRQASNKSIYIFGQVGAPGRYMFSNEMNFLDILSAADGPTDKADLRNIRINHRDNARKGVSKLDLAMYFETGDESLLPRVKTGDTIYIPEKNRLWLDQTKESTVRVIGAVNKPGRYRFDDTMTILDLLAESGGTIEDAYIENITVVNVSCCQDQARSFNLKEFTYTASFNDLPVLRAGDTVYVPYRRESGFETFRRGLNDVVKIVALGALIGL